MKYFTALCFALFFVGVAFGQQSYEASSEVIATDTPAATPRLNIQPVQEKVALPAKTSEKTAKETVKTPEKPLSNQCIVVHAEMVEVSLTMLEELGVDLQGLGLAPTKEKNAGVQKPNQRTTASDGSKPVVTASPVVDGYRVAKLLGKLKKDNLARATAAPRVSVLDGCDAHVVGGQTVKMPNTKEDGSVTFNNRREVELDVTPKFSGGNVDLRIRFQLNAPDVTAPVQIGKETVPGVSVHEVTSHLKLKSGEPFAIGGLRDVRTQASTVGLPYISEIPLVGAIFRHVEETHNEVAIFLVVRAEPEESHTINACSLQSAPLPR